jgi:hypothetical protein
MAIMTSGIFVGWFVVEGEIIKAVLEEGIIFFEHSSEVSGQITTAYFLRTPLYGPDVFLWDIILPVLVSILTHLPVIGFFA